jgi:hypothetical protein
MLLRDIIGPASRELVHGFKVGRFSGLSLVISQVATEGLIGTLGRHKVAASSARSK